VSESSFRISPREAVIAAGAIGIAFAAIFGVPVLTASGGQPSPAPTSSLERKIDALTGTVNKRFTTIERKMDVDSVRDDARFKRIECQLWDMSDCPRQRSPRPAQ